MKKIVFSVMTLILLAGCNESGVKLKTFGVVGTAEPLESSFECLPKALEFKQITVSGPIPLKIGNLYNNDTQKYYSNEIILTSEQVPFFKETIKKRFYDRFKNDDYLLVGAPDDLFGDYSNERPEFIIGAKITQVGQNRILSHDWFWSGQFTSLQFQSYLKIKWQIFSVAKREVVFETTTEGYSELGDYYKCYAYAARLASYPKAFEGAILQAIENFARNKKFHNLACSSQMSNENATMKIEDFYINKIANYKSPLNNQSSQIRSAIVTVVTPTGHGSGFFISEKGYALTNAHVVGKNAIVRVKLPTGREILADVLASDAKRDVALIKVENEGMSFLPINSKSVNIGIEVYAMGSPFDESLSSTLTKGIVSAFRKEGDLEFIQSDVSVQKGNSGGPLMDSNGNVVGICVSIVAPEGFASAGLNFFIPIQEAIDALNIKFK